MSLKVLMLNKGFHPWTGGIETVVRQISEGIPSEEYAIEVLACHKEPLKKTSVESLRGIRVTKIFSLGTAASTPIAPSYIANFKKKVKDFDLIHLHTPFPLGETALAKTKLRKDQKVLITVHADPQLTRWGGLFKFYAPVFNQTLEKADQIVVTAPNNKKNFISLNRFKEKTSIIPLAPDFIPNAAVKESIKKKLREKYNLKEDDKIVLYVGRLSKYKGIDYLIRAIKNVDAKLLLAGSGPLRDSLAALTKELGISEKVIFTGFVEDDLLPVFYSLSDVFVLPSINEGEAFGIVQVEALNFGLPIVNTSLPTGVPFVSRDGETGYTVPPKNSKELAVALNKLLNDHNTYEQFSKKAKERAKEFTVDKMLTGYKNIYDELLKSDSEVLKPG